MLTEDEFGRLRAECITVRGLSDAERKLQGGRLRDARRHTLGGANPKLAQCYDYFEAARDDLRLVLFNLYKMVEAIEEECGGGEDAARRALPDVAAIIKKLKRLANDRDVQSRDQRHAPKGSVPATPLTANEQAAALDDGHQILRKFEERFY